MSLNYESHVPLHIQLKNIIEEKISTNQFTDQIPSERKLMEMFNVSRSTVREAVKILVREGILEKIHGKGTFVSLKSIDEWLGRLESTTETIAQMGYRPGAKLIEHFELTPPKHVREKTGFNVAYFIKRVRYADDIPIGVENHYYPLEIGKQLVKYELTDATLYDLVQDELGITFREAQQTISNGIIPKEDSLLLNLSEDSYVLKADRLIKDTSGDVIEFEKAYYNSKYYQFSINLSRRLG